MNGKGRGKYSTQDMNVLVLSKVSGFLSLESIRKKKVFWLCKVRGKEERMGRYSVLWL